MKRKKAQFHYPKTVQAIEEVIAEWEEAKKDYLPGGSEGADSGMVAMYAEDQKDARDVIERVKRGESDLYDRLWDMDTSPREQVWCAIEKAGEIDLDEEEDD